MGSVMKIAKLAAATAAVSLLAGCTTVTSGDASRDSSFKPGDAIVSLLNPGNYPTAPRPGPTLKPGADTGRILDAERMGEYVVGPWEADPQLLHVDATSTGLLLDAKVVSPTADAIAQKHQFIYGFGSARGAGAHADHPRGLQNLVLRFPTPEAAAAATAEMYAQDPTAHDPSAQLDVPIPGHPEAQAYQFTMPNKSFATVAISAHGPYVLRQWADAQESAAVSMQLATKTLDLQATRIDGFRPTDPSQFANMQFDPDGLLRRTMLTKDPILNQGLWGPRGYLHFEDDPILSSAILTEAGVDIVAIRGTHVLQARDDAAATRLAAKFTEPSADSEPGPTVPGLPSARCRASRNENIKALVNDCYAAVGRWAFEAFSVQPFDGTQKMAAQYLLLTGK